MTEKLRRVELQRETFPLSRPLHPWSSLPNNDTLTFGNAAPCTFKNAVAVG